MKIVNLQTFLTLPPETLFSKYEPQCFEELAVKGENTGIGPDFYSVALVDSVRADSSEDRDRILSEAEVTGKSFDLDLDNGIRDGMFDPDQLFAVWEKKDIAALIDVLKKCHDVAL